MSDDNKGDISCLVALIVVAIAMGSIYSFDIWRNMSYFPLLIGVWWVTYVVFSCVFRGEGK